ncbi:MAG: type II toxin-antitoxin system VapC family toxin [Verrucomicrobia bacterium]|nr:type II toxin-antitoxin system VapC family toxin [Verrucomicrobiota bacterium]
MQNLDKIGAAVLDTHAWVWMSAGAPEAGAAATFRGRCVVSAISVWEVSMLAQKGRLELAPDLDVWLSINLTAPAELEPISPAICIASCQLPEFHGDPADRLIVATAITLGLPLITADRKIIEWNQSQARLQTLSL